MYLDIWQMENPHLQNLVLFVRKPFNGQKSKMYTSLVMNMTSTNISGYIYDDRGKDSTKYHLVKVLWESPLHFLAEFEDIDEPILICRELSGNHQVLNEDYLSHLFTQTFIN